MKVSGDAQSDTVGQQMPNPLVVQVNDASGAPVANVPVVFQVIQGGGTLTASGTTGVDGRTQTSWTLGTIVGTNHQVRATVTAVPPVVFGATAVADVPTELLLISGNNQTGQPSTALAAPIVVRVEDQFNNPVQGRTVDFVITAGGGSRNPTSAATGANGQAQTVWTLGAALGAQTLEAQSGTLTGSPVAFAATSSNLTLTNVQPDTLVEGQSATLTGDGFDATPGNNTVIIGGVAAAVTVASPTSLTVTVPAFNCQPARDVNVTVTVGSGTTNIVSRRLHPPAFLSLVVGEQAIVDNPAQFCLQFRPSASGGDAYMVGVGAPAELPLSLMPYSLSTVTGGAAAAASVTMARPGPEGGTVVAGRPDLGRLARRMVHARAERRLREWEERNLSQLTASARGGREVTVRSSGAAMPPPAVGDTIRFRIFDLDGPGFCSDTVPSVLTTVRAVGAAGVWVTDNANPAVDAFTLAEIQAYSDTFDTKIYPVDTLYFGTPSDIDNNQRVVIVLTIAVNRFTSGVAGFVFSGDLSPRTSCVASNEGEIFYGQVPDPGNVAGTGPLSKADVVDFMPALIAHEFAHNIQQARRRLASGVLMSIWEMEGQASLAEEVVGHSVLGNSTGQNYGVAVAFGNGVGDRWYAGNFAQLGLYYGWNGTGVAAGDTLPNAPTGCTLFGTTALVTSCAPAAFYGASWAFLRYLSDRFGPTYPGGETQLHRDLISKNVGVRGRANIDSVVGVNFDSLLVQWGGMLYADDRVPGATTPLTMTSWNMLNVFNGLVSPLRLRPTQRGWTTFTDMRSLRGGSNSYTLITSGGARPALAVRVRDPGDATLSTTMGPRLWVVRTQ